MSLSRTNEPDMSRSLKVYSGLIQLTKILHTINYSIGRQYYIFNEMIHHARDDFFNLILSFHNKTLSVIFKDYNLSSKPDSWMLSEGQGLLESVLTESVA